MAEGNGRHVEWAWLSGILIVVVFALIGVIWNEKAKQAADDHQTIETLKIDMPLMKADVRDVKTAVEEFRDEQRAFRGVSNARWGALLEALPDVEKKLRKTSPAFSPEWHYDTKTDTPR